MKSVFLIKDTVILAAKTAALIIENGGEISRAEDSAVRICTAYGIKNPSVFALNSIVIVSCSIGYDGFTHSVRIKSVEESMNRLESLNEFSRNICAYTPPINSAKNELEQICTQKINTAKSAFGAILTAASFTLFYGGSFADFVLSSLLAAMIFFGNTLLIKATANPLVPNAVLSLISGLVAMGAVHLGICSSFDAVTLGCLMQLFPGISMINSASSLLSNNTISAILQLKQSILNAFFIAAGFALSIYLWNNFLYQLF